MAEEKLDATITIGRVRPNYVEGTLKEDPTDKELLQPGEPLVGTEGLKAYTGSGFYATTDPKLLLALARIERAVLVLAGVKLDIAVGAVDNESGFMIINGLDRNTLKIKEYEKVISETDND